MEREPWKLSFEWNKKEHAAAPGGLLKDIWALIMNKYIDLSEDLIRFACSHPFFYNMVVQSVELQEKASIASFSLALSSKDFEMTKTSCQLLASHEKSKIGPDFCQELDVNTAIVECQRCASHNRPVQVDFKLLSDFKTEDYVSYFNLSVCAFLPDQDMRKTSGSGPFLFHYFMDGDLWECYYDDNRRAEAQWSQGDIISIQLGMIQLPRNATLSDVVCTRIHSGLDVTMNPEPYVTPKGAALVLSPDQAREGWTFYVALYRNGKMVYEPIMMEHLDRLEYLTLWITCKFAEFKDKVEIERNVTRLPSLVLKKDGDKWKYEIQK